MASGSPERFADVTAIGPRTRAIDAGHGVVGQANAQASRASGQRRGQDHLRAQIEDERERTRPESLREPLAPGGITTAR